MDHKVEFKKFQRAKRIKAAKCLRSGICISYCDSTIIFKNGKFEETHMGYFDDGHGFISNPMTWLEVLKDIKSGNYN